MLQFGMEENTIRENTVILSFLKRERYFANVSDLSTTLTIPECFLKGHKRSKTLFQCSCKPSGLLKGPGRKNAFERIMKNVHVYASKTKEQL